MLRDGRTLAFNISGSGAVPVMAFHGMGSSHRTWSTKPQTSLAELCPDVQLIAIDRPGYGDSSPPPAGYSYTQWASDVATLADALGIERFAVAGHSSGGPYALACAATLKERVVACACVSGDPPYVHPRVPPEVHKEGADFPGEGGLYGVDPVVKFGKWRHGDLQKDNPDKWHAWKSGVLGFVLDYSLERLPWSFRIEDVSHLGGACCFWVGGDDYDGMKLGAPWMQSLVAGSALRVVDGGGHGFKSEPQHLKAILDELVRHAKLASKGPRVQA